jgi:type I restriction enzyme, S subunit
MGKYRGHEKYKDSGVEWLGEIPNHWQLKRLRFILESQLVNGLFKKREFWGTGNLIVNVFDVYTENSIVNISSLDRVECNDDDLQRYSAKHGDFFLVRSSLKLEGIGKSASLLNPEEEMVFECHLIRGRPDQKQIDPKLLILYLNCQLTRSLLVSRANQVTMTTIDQSKFKDIHIPLPPLDEQESIAHFLDRKTSQIDALVAKKEALLEKLDEKRTALISHAVTKGLDPNVSMKDSGVEWLGEIPEHWIVSKARFASSIFVPQRNKPELNSDEGLPWVTMDDMSSERIKETLFKVSDIAFKIAGSKMLKKNSVIASCIGNFGICAINDVDVIINQQLQAFIPFSTIIPEYLCEIVRISNDYFKMIATAATVVYVNQSGFANMPILLPPKEEQEEIVNFTVLKITKIDQQKAKVKEAIALLKEYRTALITNAVTGKIDVRQEASLS